MSVRSSLAAAATLVVVATASGCSIGSEIVDAADGSRGSDGAQGQSRSQAEPRAEIATNLGDGPVAVDRRVEVSAEGGHLQKVTVRGRGIGPVPGKLSDGVWRASGRLEPATRYVVRTVTETDEGATQRDRNVFRTADLGLDQQTYASVAPLDGETVGVGMPVVVTFDLPVTDRAAIERHMSVTSTPAQAGSWHWLSDREVHWRPKEYWQAGTDVQVDVDINSIPAGGGIYGQESRSIGFHVGDANIYRVDAAAHTMEVYSNGSLLRTLPITTGKAGFTTRSGVKVIMEKFEERRMNSETIGIDRNSAEGYDIDDVAWAMRLTNSGEFIHAAPWSVASQGRENVSHGCTGMSTANAAWLYAMSKRGDVVEYTGTDRPMTLDNGFGDWNASFPDYRAGSALS